MRCRIDEVLVFLSNSHCMPKPLLCENKITENNVEMMNQVWGSFLSCTLTPVIDKNNNPESMIFSLIKHTARQNQVTLQVANLSLTSCLSKLFEPHLQSVQFPLAKNSMIQFTQELS